MPAVTDKHTLLLRSATGRRDGLFTLFPPLRKAIARRRPGREHIVPDEQSGEHIHFVSEYDPSWPETWREGETRAEHLEQQARL
jgi:hypothetical protein